MTIIDTGAALATSKDGAIAMKQNRKLLRCCWSFILLGCLFWAAGAPVLGQGASMVVRPAEIRDVLVNPGMGITTFQRFNGEPIYPGLEWSEVGPEGPMAEAPPPEAAARTDFPQTSVAYLRWFWSQIEPEAGNYRWQIVDSALAQARQHGQCLTIRVMPYDQRNPLPEWYRKSGALRANQDTDQDGKIWSPDADDPLYAQHWGALVRELGRRYDGHPDLDTVDISTVGYWGEGWGPYLPAWAVQQALIDVYFEAFKGTPLLMNFDELKALAYGAQKGAGWRLDCWGDMGRPGRTFMHMLDSYPQGVVRAGVQEVWRRSPVSLETCGTPGSWKKNGYTSQTLDYILDQALRWHATTINIKSTAIPEEWKPAFQEFQRKIGYRFMLRKLEYPGEVRAGQMMSCSMWWFNAGVAPVYREYWLAVRLYAPQQNAVIRTSANLKEWLPGDAVVDENLYVPETLAPGKYRFQVGILAPRTGQPAIRLAIAGRLADGWYDLGEIAVK
jgi:hypothetical protein